MVPYVDVGDACGAPGGLAAWIRRMMEAGSSSSLGIRPRFSPLERLAEFEACWDRDRLYPNPGLSPFAPGWRWADRAALLRYRYLDSFEKTAAPSQPPDAPQLAKRWIALAKKEAALEREKRRLAADIQAEREAGTVIPKAAIKKGRHGDPVLRDTMDALIGLYAELYGVLATETRDGPAVRFAAAFFDGLDEVQGNWMWILALGAKITSDPTPPAAPWRYVVGLKCPDNEKLRNELRRSLERSTSRSQELLRAGPRKFVREDRCPAPGAFALVTDGTAKWGTVDGSMPDIYP